MSFREKSAWISLIALLLLAGAFVVHMPWTLRPDPRQLTLYPLLVALGLLVVVEVVGHAIVIVRSPKEELTPRDERERFLDLKALRFAFYVLIAGNALTILLVHHGANGFGMALLVLYAVTVALIANYAARIYFYRRG
jgi:hypothetical protein